MIVHIIERLKRIKNTVNLQYNTISIKFVFNYLECVLACERHVCQFSFEQCVVVDTFLIGII